MSFRSWHFHIFRCSKYYPCLQSMIWHDISNFMSKNLLFTDVPLRLLLQILPLSWRFAYQSNFWDLRHKEIFTFQNFRKLFYVSKLLSTIISFKQDIIKVFKQQVEWNTSVWYIFNIRSGFQRLREFWQVKSCTSGCQLSHKNNLFWFWKNWKQ